MKNQLSILLFCGIAAAAYAVNISMSTLFHQAWLIEPIAVTSLATIYLIRKHYILLMYILVLQTTADVYFGCFACTGFLCLIIATEIATMTVNFLNITDNKHGITTMAIFFIAYYSLKNIILLLDGLSYASVGMNIVKIVIGCCFYIITQNALPQKSRYY
jgi:hypothetical protein